MDELRDVTEGFEPAALWRNFEALSRVPRPSKQEEQVLAWLKEWAGERGFDWSQDEVGNLIIRRPGSGGGENAPIVVLQGHVDMVCEKNSDVEHDFLKDPIRFLVNGDWLTADGTTLGADNGIGVATGMAILEMDSDATLPPIEVLLTVDEETGLTGAFALDGSIVNGRILLNLDSEDWGEVTVGCCGGGGTDISLSVTREAGPKDMLPFELNITGLMGGHSGVDIHEERANAVKFLGEHCDLLVAGHGARIASLLGGDKHNAIPREAFATLLLPADGVEAAKAAVKARTAAQQAEYGSMEKKINVELVECGDIEAVFDLTTQTNLINLVRLLPHGVIKMSHDVKGLVETSSNLASIKDGGDNYEFHCSTRSSVRGALDRVREEIAHLADMCGAKWVQDEPYPGWQPNLDSQILKQIIGVHERLFGSKPEVAAIHAGLECGVIGEKVPGMDMVSYGPTIKAPHSPDERIQISTVEPYWALTLELLRDIALS